MDEACILVVDDEPRLTRFLQANLESVGYRVVSAGEGESAVVLAQAEEPDLIILDLILPGIDGFEVCRRVRESSSVPIIMLTARSEESDKVRGLNLGADDYLTKPFSAQELLARVRALLRRSLTASQQSSPPMLSFKEMTIDLGRHKVTVRGDEVSLSPTEYKLLCELATNAGRVLLHEDLLARVWGTDYRDEIEYLRVYVRYLRQKIEADASQPKYILSKPGIGYMFAKPA